MRAFTLVSSVCDVVMHSFHSCLTALTKDYMNIPEYSTCSMRKIRPVLDCLFDFWNGKNLVAKPETLYSQSYELMVTAVFSLYNVNTGNTLFYVVMIFFLL